MRGHQNRQEHWDETLKNQDFSGLKLDRFLSVGSRFENCTFGHMATKNMLFGSGRKMSHYIHCTFDHAKLRVPPGGDAARFENCTFIGTTIHNWMTTRTELINCRFTGTLNRGYFHGTITEADEQHDLGRTVNQFEGNDFSQATLKYVDFRTGIDLTKQQLPTGHEYIYLKNPLATFEALKELSIRNNKPITDRLLSIIQLYIEEVENGQEQIHFRIDDFYKGDDLKAVKKIMNDLLNA